MSIGGRGFVFDEFVLDCVDEGHPAGLDDIFADANGSPNIVVVLAFDHDSDAGRSSGFGVDDANTVVHEMHLLQTWIPFT